MNWLRRLLHRSRNESQLDKELRFHLDQQIADYVAAGMSLDEARRRAQQEFGGIARVKEEVRDTRWETHLENLFRDFRYSFRTLRKDQRFFLIAIFALALGIGASTIVFSVVYNVFFHALPYKNFDRSVILSRQNLGSAGGWKERQYFSPGEVRAFQEQNHIFEEIVAYASVRLAYDDGKSVRYLPQGAIVSANTFDYLGVSPLMGRTISLEDCVFGAPPVFVMNYRLWQREFGADPQIIGKSFILRGRPTVLVGIMPPRFNAFGASFWMPASLEEHEYLSLEGGASVVGRLKPGIPVQTAAADLNAIAHRMHSPGPDGIFPEDNFAIVAQTTLDSIIGNFKKTLYALLAAVFLLLLIACSNVANLLLARASTRELETAVRATLGATRGRLIRQLFVESFVLAGAASLAGCVLAYFGLQLVVALIPTGTLPEETVIRMNAPVLLMALGIATMTALLCGLAPALHIVSGDLQPRLTGSSKGVGDSFRHGKLRAVLVVSEVALSILLLICAGLLMRSCLVLTRVNLGFDSKNVIYFRIDPTTYAQYPDRGARLNALTGALLNHFREIPGVTSVAESTQEPPLRYDWSDTIIPGKPHVERWETRYEICSDGYFKTLGLPLIRGNFFSGDDVAAKRYVMVINQTFARQYFAGEDPLGHKVKLDVLDRPYLDVPHNIYFEVVGIVGDYKTRGPQSWETFPEVFIPYSIQAFSWRTFMVRTSVDPNSFIRNIQAEARRVDPAVRIVELGTLEGALRDFYRGPQFELAVLAAFALVGLALVTIGIFSVMAYTVSLQTHEIGIRMALGAQQNNILRSALVNGFRLIASGILAGVAASLAITRFLSSQMSGVSPTDPWTFAAVVTIVVVVGMAACLVPARRAASVDPLVALRYE